MPKVSLWSQGRTPPPEKHTTRKKQRTLRTNKKRCLVGSFTVRFPHWCNGKSLSWTGLTREWWCCTVGLVNRLDMSTCQTSIKTDILLVHCWRPLLGTTDNTRHLESKIPNWTRGCSGQTQLRIYQNTHRRSTAETAVNPIGQAFPVIHMHLVGISEQHPQLLNVGTFRTSSDKRFDHFLFSTWN